MSVNNTNNNFKVSTVGNGLPQEDWATQTTDPKAESIDDLFDIGTDNSSGSTGNSDPIDDYTCGDISGGTYTNTTDPTSAAQLESFPPTWEEVQISNENAINYLDLVMQRYEKAKADLRELKASYEAAIDSGTCTAAEIQDLLNRCTLIDESLARCGVQIDKVSELASERVKEYISELKSMKDLNLDGWIGRPREGYYLHYNDDGTITYLDKNGKPIACPLMDPEYSAKIIDGDGLTMIDATESITDGSDDLQATDVFLKLDESAITNNSNTFGCASDICIPEYFYVERGEDALDSVCKTEYDSGEMKMVLYNEWENNSQKMPDDLSKYVQVKVTSVTVHSVECGKTVDGEAVYRHVVEFRNGEDLITRISIEGCNTKNSQLPCATEMEDGGTYIAASSVGIALHGSDRFSPIEVDASGLNSTGRHVVPDLAAQLGISPPNDEGQGDMSYAENIGVLSDRDFSTYEWTGTDWQETSKNIDTYDGYNDRFLSSSEATVDGPVPELRSGIFLSGIRGSVIGTAYNDCIVTQGVHELSTYAEEHLPEDAKQIAKGDAAYSNFVNTGKGGNDIVVATGGDNFISQATLVWINDCKNPDENYIALPDMPTGTIAEDNVKIAPNQKNFVHVEGNAEIHNPIEHSAGNTSDAQNQGQVEATDGSYKDDWYEVTGSAAFANLSDYDLDYCRSQGAISQPDQGMKDTDMESYKEEIYNEWYEELTSVPDPDEMDLDIDWDEVIGAKTDLDAEMDSFFDEMFGDLNSFIGEYQEEQQL